MKNENGNWGYRYRDWKASEDHYYCDEPGHDMFGKRVIVRCHGMGDFSYAEYKD